MERAAQALARHAAQSLQELPPRTPVLALIGPGNNGADALLASLALERLGFATRRIALPLPEQASADARRARALAGQAGLGLEGCEVIEERLRERPLVIDGLFGIGLSRPVAAPVQALMAQVREARVPVMAVDVPSGLDPDRGCVVGPDGAALPARWTITFLGDKPGLHTGEGIELSGEVRVESLGVDCPEADGELVAPALACQLAREQLPRRAAMAHKGHFGDVLVLGGAPGMEGAALLASLGAQAVGAGRIWQGQPLWDKGAQEVSGRGLTPAAGHPELMSRRLDLDGGAPGACLGSADVLLVGCGLGTSAQAERLLGQVLARTDTAWVLDADALNLIARDGALAARLSRHDREQRIVITPHPLEAARLLRCTVAQIQADRIAAACELSNRFGVVTVLKGAGTVVAEPDKGWTINASGGPILAVAGTGDVLAGVIAGILGRGLARARSRSSQTSGTRQHAWDPPDGGSIRSAATTASGSAFTAASAARLGVWLHGAAADRLAAQAGFAAGIGLAAGVLASEIRALTNEFAVHAARSCN